MNRIVACSRRRTKDFGLAAQPAGFGMQHLQLANARPNQPGNDISDPVEVTI